MNIEELQTAIDDWDEMAHPSTEWQRPIVEAARLVADIDDEWTAEAIYDEGVAWNMECRGETESSWPEYAELTEFAKTPWRSKAVAARLAITGGRPPGEPDGT